MNEEALDHWGILLQKKEKEKARRKLYSDKPIPLKTI
jgi:hypothetical protein